MAITTAAKMSTEIARIRIWLAGVLAHALVNKLLLKWCG
jgi:hypothetical protein